MDHICHTDSSLHLRLNSPSCKNAHSPSSLSHKAQFFACRGFLMRSFLPRFSADGLHSQGVKLLTCSHARRCQNCDSAHGAILRWNEQMDQKEGRRAPELSLPRSLFFFCSLSVPLWPLPDLSALSFFIFSPRLVFCVGSFFDDRISLSALFCRRGKPGTDGQTSYIL